MVKIHFHLIFSPACRHDNHFSNLHIFFFLYSSRKFRKMLSDSSYRPTMTTASTMNFKFSWINVRLSCHRWISSWDIISHRSDWKGDARRKKSNNTLSTRECLSTLASSYFRIRYSCCVFRFTASLGFFYIFRRLIFQIIYFGGEPQTKSPIFD